jgi:PIN domain nuclease of toxin-antitoxin system
MVVHLDTHVALWLHDAMLSRLKPALPHLKGQQVAMSPMALFELQVLHEIGRTAVPAHEIVDSLSERYGLSIAHSTWENVARQALSLTWTRDPFDRLITAHAMADRVPLVTKDRNIRDHYPSAVWG